MREVHHQSHPALFLAAAAFLVCAAPGYPAPRTAQPAAPPTEISSNRYLLIVDTSVAMEPRGRAMLKTVEQMLKSGLSGQLREGDTLGVWTYNATLYAGRFSLQRWSPTQEKAITSRVLSFLKGQKCELFPLLDSLLPALDGVLRNSQFITVILVSAGDGAMQGTPFDHRINEFWEGAREKQKAAKMPLVVVLRARDGHITDCTLNLPPGPVQMPPASAEPQLASPSPQPAPPETPLKAQTPVPQPPTVSAVKAKPLQPPKIEEAPAPRARPTISVVTNEPVAQESPATVQTPSASAEPFKAETNSVKPTGALPATATTSNAPPVVEAERPKTPPPVLESAKAEAKAAPAPASNEIRVAQTEQPNPPAPVAESTKPEPKPTPPPKPAPEPARTQTAPLLEPTASQPPPAPNPEIAKGPVEKPAGAAPAQPPAQPTPTASKVEPAKASEPLPSQAAPVQVVVAPLPPPPAMLPAKAIEAPKLAFGPKPTFEPGAAAQPNAATLGPTAGSLPGAQTARDPGTRSEASHVSSPAPSRLTEVRPSAPLSNAVAGLAATPSSPSAPQAPPAPPVQTATATPAGSFLSQRITWVAGGFLAAAACAFAWLALRRSRATPQGSLITRSLDTDKKP